MEIIQIGRSRIVCKDYECSHDDVYLPKDKLRLWLYITLTDACPAACPFCVFSHERSRTGDHVNPEKLLRILSQISPFVSGVSITGGEPMTDIPLLEEVIHAVQETIPPEIELDMVTNGLNIRKLAAVRGLERVATVHISRHAAEDKLNASLMHWKNAPGKNELKEAFSSLSDPGMTVLNCVLQKPGVHDRDSVCDYMEMAGEIGAANVSLIGMFLANDFCRENYISPETLHLEGDPRFTVWNHFHDHDYCQCSTGDYLSKSGYVRYYFRSQGKNPSPDCCRQLVYGADNKLRAGFGNAEVLEI